MNGGPSIIGIRVSDDMQQRAALGIEQDVATEAWVAPARSPSAEDREAPEPAWRSAMRWVLAAFALLWVVAFVVLAIGRVSGTYSPDSA